MKIRMVTTYLRRVYSHFSAHVFDVPPRLLAFQLFLLLLFFPVAGLNESALFIFVKIFLFAIFAASWDLLVGRSGQISLGHALFFGVGAYGTALLYKYFGLPPWVTIPFGVLICVLVSLLIGLPSVRVKGPYLALVTMSFPIILSRLVKWVQLRPITEGEAGLRNLPLIPTELFDKIGFSWKEALYMRSLAYYYIALLLLLVSGIILYRVANSKTGLVFVSILDDELASKASGINVTKYKLMAFAISSLFGGLVGAVYTHLTIYVNPTAFAVEKSFTPIVITILGGIGTIYGPIVGAHIYYAIDSYVLPELRNLPLLGPLLTYTQWQYTSFLILAVIVVVLVIKWPRGVARFTTDKLKDLEEARDIEERGKWIWKTYKKK